MDRAAEFRSRSLKAAASVLNVVIVDIPRARGDLKGKIENWFDKYERQIRKFPGQKGSRPDKRIEETAIPKLTMAEVTLVSVVWAVDIYNYERHGETGEKPAMRYQKSIDDGLILKLPPPIQLLGPATSVAKQATITDRGITFDNLRYDSEALQKHWFSVGNRKFFARPDEDDVRICWVHDGAKTWIRANLQGKYADIQMTRSEMARRRKIDKAAAVDSPEEHEKAMRARANYGKLIDTLAPRDDKPKKLSRQTKASSHLNKPRIDLDASAAPVTGYSAGSPVPENKFDGMGPFEKPTITQKVLQGTLSDKKFPLLAIH